MISARLDRIKVGTPIIPAPIGLITDRNATGRNKVPWNGTRQPRSFPPFNALSAVISVGMLLLLMLLDVDGDVDGHPMISSSTLSRSARNDRGARTGVPV